MKKKELSKAASILGRVKSKKKTEACRKNGIEFGGRPAKCAVCGLTKKEHELFTSCEKFTLSKYLIKKNKLISELKEFEKRR